MLAGLALGTSTSADATMGIIIAIVCHKASAAMALGISLIGNKVSKCRYGGLMSLFSIITPSGVGIGLLIYTQLQGTNAMQLTSGVVGSLSAGSFLYIAST